MSASTLITNPATTQILYPATAQTLYIANVTVVRNTTGRGHPVIGANNKAHSALRDVHVLSIVALALAALSLAALLGMLMRACCSRRVLRERRWRRTEKMEAANPPAVTETVVPVSSA